MSDDGSEKVPGRRMVGTIVALDTLTIVIVLVGIVYTPLAIVSAVCYVAAFILASILPRRNLDESFHGRSKRIFVVHIVTVIFYLIALVLIGASATVVVSGVVSSMRDGGQTWSDVTNTTIHTSKELKDHLDDQTLATATAPAIAALAFLILSQIGVLLSLILSGGLLCRMNGHKHCICC